MNVLACKGYDHHIVDDVSMGVQKRSVTPPERDRGRIPTTQDFSYMSSVLHACHSGSEIGQI